MNKLNYEILSAIDNIETTVMESEINVMNSLIDSYDKSIMILENCDDNTDVDSFDIFQESVIMEADENGNMNKIKKVTEKFIGAIETLLSKLSDLIKTIINKVKKSKRVVSEIKVGNKKIEIKFIKNYKKLMDDLQTRRDMWADHIGKYASQDYRTLQTSEGLSKIHDDVDYYNKYYNKFGKTDDLFDKIRDACLNYRNQPDNEDYYDLMDVNEVLDYLGTFSSTLDQSIRDAEFIVGSLKACMKEYNGSDKTIDRYKYVINTLKADMRNLVLSCDDIGHTLEVSMREAGLLDKFDTKKYTNRARRYDYDKNDDII